DLDELAVARALAGPGDDARGHRDHLLARAAGEVDALVEGLAAVEGVGALTEIRGDESFRDRAPLGVDLFLELAGEDDVLERRELRIALRDALLELSQHGGEIRDLGAHALTLALRAAARRIPVEIELAAVDVRHLREALAEGIEADDVSVHFPEPHGHGIHAQLQLLVQLRDLVLLLGEDRTQALRLGGDRGAHRAPPEDEPERENAPEDGEREAADHT